MHLAHLPRQKEEEGVVARVVAPEPLVGLRARAGAVEAEAGLGGSEGALHAADLFGLSPDLRDQDVLVAGARSRGVVVLLADRPAVGPEEVGEDRAFVVLGLLDVLVVELARKVPPKGFENAGQLGV